MSQRLIKTMEHIERAVAIVGSQAELARACGVTDQAVSKWRAGTSRPGLEACRAIEQATDMAVRRQDLRPEWFS